MSVRDKLNESKMGLGVAIGLISVAVIALGYYYFSTARPHAEVTKAFYSDDDGQSYYTDSVYKFPPFDHDGKTSVRAILGVSNGHRSIAYLVRYPAASRQKLQQAYDDAIKNGSQVQQIVLGLMHSPAIGNTLEAKLPGGGHTWVPWSRFSAKDVKAPDGELYDDFLEQP